MFLWLWRGSELEGPSAAKVGQKMPGSGAWGECLEGRVLRGEHGRPKAGEGAVGASGQGGCVMRLSVAGCGSQKA